MQTNTVTLDTVTQVGTLNSETTTVEYPTHLSINTHGATRVVVKPIAGKRSRRSCSCSRCLTCAREANGKGSSDGVELRIRITSYNENVGSGDDLICFTSKESFKEFVKFASSVDVDSLFNTEAPVTAQ